MATIDPNAPSIEREPRLPPLRPDHEDSRPFSAVDDDPFRERRDASLRRHGLAALLAVIGLLAAVVVVEDLHDPARDQAVAATVALDEAARLVRAGDVVVTSQAREIHPGVVAALGGSAGATPVLVAETADHCYTLHLTDQGRTIGQRFSGDWSCDPTGAVGLLSGPRSGRDVGWPASGDRPYPWTWMLPEAEAWPPGYLAVVILLTGLLIGGVTRAAIIGVTGRAPGDE